MDRGEQRQVVEVWRPAPVCADYEVSDQGGVRSRVTGRALVNAPRVNGYVSVSLTIAPKVKRRFYVHRLVAEAFCGALPSGMQVSNIVNNRSWIQR